MSSEKINKAEFCIRVVGTVLKDSFNTYLGKNLGKMNLVSLISNTENILLTSSVRKTIYIANAISKIPDLGNVPLLFGFSSP